jgi:hypothetical protein
MKPTLMQKKYLLRIALATLLITGSVIILSSSKKAGKQQNCKESTEGCCKNKDESAPSEEMIWESFSRQFISSIEISH